MHLAWARWPSFLAMSVFYIIAFELHAEPYDLRGIRLGMSLTQFRAMPHPDGKKTKAICQGDPEAGRMFLYPSGPGADVGAIECNIYEFKSPSYSPNLSPSWHEAGLNVATIGVYMEYEFIPDPEKNGEYALYLMIVRSNVGNWETFWSAYNTKYGPPDSLSDASTQNRMGAIFNNVEAVWDNSESTITLVKRYLRVDNTYIFYGDSRLLEEIERLKLKKHGKPSDKL